MSADKDDLLKEFDRLVAEGGYDPSNYNAVDIEYQYSCTRGVHKWVWYKGFHLEQYWFCELCPVKDLNGAPPSRI